MHFLFEWCLFHHLYLNYKINGNIYNFNFASVSDSIHKNDSFEGIVDEDEESNDINDSQLIIRIRIKKKNKNFKFSAKILEQA